MGCGQKLTQLVLGESEDSHSSLSSHHVASGSRFGGSHHYPLCHTASPPAYFLREKRPRQIDRCEKRLRREVRRLRKKKKAIKDRGGGRGEEKQMWVLLWFE